MTKQLDYFGIFENLTAQGGTVYYVKAVYTDGSSAEMPTNGEIHRKERAMRHAWAYTNAIGGGTPQDKTSLPSVSLDESLALMTKEK